MTLLTPPDSRLICRIQLTGAGRGVSLALSLGQLAPGARFLTFSEHLVYEMEGLDEAAQSYALSNWQGGILSGVRYAFRALKVPLQQVHVHELRGQLGSGDIWAISSAAAIAVARLLARPVDFPVELADWKMAEEIRLPRSSGAEAASPGAQATPSARDVHPEATNDSLSSSRGASQSGDTQEMPTEPGAPADHPSD